MKDELFRAIESRLPGFSPGTIFDVGANAGSVAIAFAEAFPGAQIFAFEPVQETYKTLLATIGDDARIRPFNLALGRKSGPVQMRIKAASVSNRIAGWRDLFKPRERVTMRSGDELCAELDLRQIDILKIDAEGHDLEVLRGFRAMLKAGRIALLEAEVALDPDNRRHVPFERVKRFLEPLGYRLFLLYEQTSELAHSGRAHLRRADVVFLSPALIQSTRRLG